MIFSVSNFHRYNWAGIKEIRSSGIVISVALPKNGVIHIAIALHRLGRQNSLNGQPLNTENKVPNLHPIL